MIKNSQVEHIATILPRVLDQLIGGEVMRNRFFESLYKNCSGQIELRVFGKVQKFYDPMDMTGINSFCNQHRREDLYFGVATRDGQDKGGTRGGKQNVVHIPAAWCDIDFKVLPPEQAYQKLKSFPFQPSIIVRSGGGVHLYWLLKEPAARAEISTIEDVNRRIAVGLGGDLNACDAARVLRIPDSLNYKYKKARQVVIRRMDDFYYELGDFLDILPQSDKTARSGLRSVSEKDPSGQAAFPDWFQNLMQGVAKGARNNSGARIAGYLVNYLPAPVILTILRTWNKSNGPPLEDNEVAKIVNSVSRYQPSARNSRPKIDPDHVYDTERMLMAYRAHIESLRQNLFKTGIEIIDDKIRGVAGGEVLTVIARSGSFKTACLQNFLKAYIKSASKAAAFFSLEMPVASLVERYLGMITGSSGRIIESMFAKKGDEASLAEDMLKEELSGLFVIDAGVSVSDIARYVGVIERNYSTQVGAIGVDYLGLMEGSGQNVYERVSRVAREVKQMAKLLNLPVIMLCQTSRKGGEGEREITLDMARDSGAIEESADTILGLYQVESTSRIAVGETSPMYDLICKILKNRKGPRNLNYRLSMNPETFELGPDAEPYTPPAWSGAGF